MLAAYSEGEQMIGRHIIEDVADNLDLLPRNEALHTALPMISGVPSGRVLRADAKDDLWEGQARTAATKPRMFTEEAQPANRYSNGNSNGHSNGNSNGYSNGHSNGFANGNGGTLIFEDIEDEVDLELGGRFYKI
jgi:hypothetical protein